MNDHVLPLEACVSCTPGRPHLREPLLGLRENQTRGRGLPSRDLLKRFPTWQVGEAEVSRISATPQGVGSKGEDGQIKVKSWGSSVGSSSAWVLGCSGSLLCHLLPAPLSILRVWGGAGSPG